jgi:hypothetical protein
VRGSGRVRQLADQTVVDAGRKVDPEFAVALLAGDVEDVDVDQHP